MKHIKLFEQFVNESRSIEKIEKDRARVVKDMTETVTDWKAAKASGDKQAEASFLQRLKDLTAEKTSLEKELNTAIASKDRFIQLVISEDNSQGNINEQDVYIEFLNKEKGFKPDKKHFKGRNAYQLAVDWGNKNLDKFNLDMIKVKPVNEGELADQTIFDLWEDIYGEKFIHEYPKMFKVLKNRPKVDRYEFSRIWSEIYGQDFAKEYSQMWDKMGLDK